MADGSPRDGTPDGKERADRALRSLEGLPGDRVTWVIATVTVLALLARFVFLGQRIAHWDEARIGYWTLDFARTGRYYYRPILHGPFLQLVTARVFAVVGATDYAMRIVPALVGGLLPLVALLLRERLGDAEVVGLSLLLAVNPVLLYFSRFMRGDVLVGAFMVAGFAMVVRGLDVGDRRYLYPAVGSVGLGFTVKENALAYLAAWLGASVLLLDHRLLLARATGFDPGTDRESSGVGAGGRWVSVLAEELRRLGGTLRSLAPTMGLAAVGFLAIVVFFYAPRGNPPTAGEFYGPYCSGTYDRLVDLSGVVGLGEVLASPGAIPDVIAMATVGSAEVFVCQWVGPRATADGANAYLPYLGDLARTVGFGAGALAGLALLGFAVDRYGGEAPRDLVQFTFYWGVASLLGYPLITDIAAPWTAVHVVLPLAVPAAVGLAHVYRFGRAALAEGRGLRGAVGVAVLAVVAAQVGGVAVYSSYIAPQSPENDLAQYAQPSGDMRPVLEEMATVAGDRDGPHVLVYGEFYVDGGRNVPRKPGCIRWFRALPLPWYFASSDVEVTCAHNASAFDERFDTGRVPPIVVANATVENGRARPPEALEKRLTGYELHVYEMRTHHDLAQAHPTAFYVRRNLSAGPARNPSTVSR